MKNQKRVAVLVIIALILAVTAIALNVTDSSSEVPTTAQANTAPTGAVIGVTIFPNEVEDKGAEVPGAQA